MASQSLVSLQVASISHYYSLFNPLCGSGSALLGAPHFFFFISTPTRCILLVMVLMWSVGVFLPFLAVGGRETTTGYRPPNEAALVRWSESRLAVALLLVSSSISRISGGQRRRAVMSKCCSRIQAGFPQRSATGLLDQEGGMTNRRWEAETIHNATRNPLQSGMAAMLAITELHLTTRHLMEAPTSLIPAYHASCPAPLPGDRVRRRVCRGAGQARAACGMRVVAAVRYCGVVIERVKRSEAASSVLHVVLFLTSPGLLSPPSAYWLTCLRQRTYSRTGSPARAWARTGAADGIY